MREVFLCDAARTAIGRYGGALAKVRADDLAAEKFGGAAVVDAETRFARDYEGYAPTYFVITDLGSLAAQPDLERWLEKHATPVRKTASDRVYELPAP